MGEEVVVGEKTVDLGKGPEGWIPEGRQCLGSSSEWRWVGLD